MKIRTYSSSDYKTQRQWANVGKIVNENAQGVEMWSNGYCQRSYVYFAESDVHDGTEKELQEFFAPIRAKKRDQSKARKQRQLAAARKEQQQLIRDERIDANYCMVQKFLAVLAERERPRLGLEQDKIEIVLDIETTGLERTDEILQISIVDTAGSPLLDTLVRPYFHSAWPAAQQINKITPDAVKDAPYPHEILPEVLQIVSRAALCIGYNIDFDLGFLHDWGIALPADTQIIDVMYEFADYCAENDPNGTYRFHKLVECAHCFKYTWPDAGAHNSLGDALATLYCYKQLIT